MASGALAGVRVLDLSRVLAAPLAAQFLGDLGAEVIKVERQGAGDEAREYGPPFLKDRDGVATRDSAFFLSCNRNKKSIALDLASSEGQTIVRQLAAQSDVVLENFKTGALKKFGLDYESLRAVNPRLIYCSITGYGQTGPMARKPGYDGVFQALSGMMSVSGRPDHEPGGGPMKVGISMIDILTSHYATSAILAALYHRDVHNCEGQHIDLALLDCGLASLTHYAMSYLVSGVTPPRRGNGGFGGIPSQSFKCSDGDIFVVAGNNRQFGRFAEAIGRPDLNSDDRFTETAGRIAHREELLAILDKILLSRTVEAWLTTLDAADVPCAAINDLPAALADPQIRHREMLQEVEHPVAGPLKILSNPVRLSETPIDHYSAPPGVGEHSNEILRALGYDSTAIEGLRERKVI